MLICFKCLLFGLLNFFFACFLVCSLFAVCLSDSSSPNSNPSLTLLLRVSVCLFSYCCFPFCCLYFCYFAFVARSSHTSPDLTLLSHSPCPQALLTPILLSRSSPYCSTLPSHSACSHTHLTLLLLLIPRSSHAPARLTQSSCCRAPSVLTLNSHSPCRCLHTCAFTCVSVCVFPCVCGCVCPCEFTCEYTCECV